MLLNTYLAIESKLITIPGVKLVDWFNDQYSGTIHTAPAVFVEFPVPFAFKTLRGQFQVSPMSVRIHLATVAKADQSKKIARSILQTHEELTQAIYYALHGSWAQNGDETKLFDSLGRTALQHHQYMSGWLVTTQDFEGRVYQHEAPKNTAIAGDLAITTGVNA